MSNLNEQEIKEMTKQKELRERIAQKLYEIHCIENWAEATFCSFEDTHTVTQKRYKGIADQILALIKEAGYVKLADDQSHKEVMPTALDIERSHSGMWDDKQWFYAGASAQQEADDNAGFRKVEL